MLHPALSLPRNLGPSLVVLCALMLYISGRALVDALAGRGQVSPGRRALALWIPIVVVALAAVEFGHFEMAIAAVFSSSVAALTLVLGISLLLRPPIATPHPGRRTWAFVLPAALLVLLAGFHARLTIWHAAMFIAQGLAILLLWMDRSQSQPATAVPSPPSTSISLRWVQALIAIALAVVGGWGVCRGILDLSRQSSLFSPGVISAVTLGMCLSFAMVVSGVALSQAGHLWAAISTQVSVVLLNLCVLLPLLIALTYVPANWLSRAEVSAFHQTSMSAPSTAPTTQPAATQPQELAQPPHPGLAFPLAVWRIDTVLLVVLGLFLLPVALGRWTMGTLESMGLVVVYGAYLFMTVVFGGRW
jgi:hypothetical protein